MSQTARDEWLRAVSRIFPGLKLKALRRSLERLDFRISSGRWEGGVLGNSAGKRLSLRYTGEAENFPAWSKAVRGALRLDLPPGERPPAPGFSWLSLTWDCSKDESEELRLLSRPHGKESARRQKCRIVLAGGAVRLAALCPGRFSAKNLFPPELAKAFADFERLVPISQFVAESRVQGDGRLKPSRAWSVRFSSPVPWPRLAGLDFAAPFAGESSRLSFLMLGRKVSELRFDGEQVWAYCEL